MKEKFERYHRIKYKILHRQPFLGEVLLALRFGLAECETCYTDMKHIVFDPNFMDQINDVEFEMLVLHELYHCILNHCIRAKGKITELYNIACDIVVNSYIYKEYPRSSIGGLEFRHTYKEIEGSEYTAEEIYYDLLRNSGTSPNSQGENSTGNGSNSWGSHTNWLDIDENEDDLQYTINEAKRNHSDHLPTCLRKLLDNQFDSQIDWKLVLRDYLSAVYDQEDYSFQQRDTRYFDAPYVMPSLIEEEGKQELKDVLIGVDVSGSVRDEEYMKFIKEIKTLQNLFQFDSYLTFFNSQATKPVHLKSNTNYDFASVHGYGGTSYEAVFDLLEDRHYKMVIIFTDGYCNFPPEPNIPVIWIVLGHANVPYGKYIEMN